VDHAKGMDTYTLSLRLGSFAAKANVIDAARTILGTSKGDLSRTNSALIGKDAQLCLTLPNSPEPQLRIRSLIPVDTDNAHATGFMQASTLAGQLPFEVSSAQLKSNAIISPDLHAPELTVHSVPMPIPEVRAAMTGFAQIPGMQEA
jgi:hypothetical protein